ncbi:MAG: VanW family protein [Cyanobacteria bacterium SZAS TMP-1]|nr:VanW family protein [Cyanobacteria bacterium SZAS TMP-1]
MKKAQLILLLLTPIALLVYYLSAHPFKETLASRTIDLSKYTSSQRLNFYTATKNLDGAVIKPHAVFSFNGRVGPRQAERGFVGAPSYLAGQKQNSAGGGICLVSSTLYQVALLSGMDIVERTPHTNTVSSVAPGLDATVWYGRADLKFKNPYDQAVAIDCHQEGQQLIISIKGDAATQVALNKVSPELRRRQIGPEGDRTLIVEVYRKDSGHEHLVSRDRYRLTH